MRVSSRDRLTLRYLVGQNGELLDQDGRLDRIEAAIEPDTDMFVSIAPTAVDA